MHRGRMRLVPVVTRTDLVDCGAVRFEHDVVDRSLLRGELAADRKRTRDIRRVRLVFAAGVDEQQVTVLQRLVVLVIVENAAVWTTAHDRVVRGIRVAQPELVHQFRHDLEFLSPRLAVLHRTDVRAGGDPGRLPHHVHLDLRLEQSHVVQYVIESDYFLRRMPSVTGLSPQTVDPPDDALIEIGVHAHLVINAGAVLEQARKDVVEIRYRESVIRAVVTAGSGRAGALPIPGLPRGIAVAHEQDVLRLFPAGNQDCNRFGLAEARQIEEVAVLTVRVLDVVVTVTNRCRGQDGDRVAAHLLDELAAPAGEFVSTNGGHGWFQCSGASGGSEGWSRNGSSSSNTSCTPTRTNSTSSA